LTRPTPASGAGLVELGQQIFVGAHQSQELRVDLVAVAGCFGMVDHRFSLPDSPKLRR
jgi:hypothetical protein